MTERFAYDKFRNRLSLMAAVLVAVIVTVLSVMFSHQLMSYSAFKNCVIAVLAIVTFLCTFFAIYQQRKSDYYGRYWLAFAIVLGMSNGFLVGLVFRTLLFFGNDFSGLIGPGWAIFILSSLLAAITSYISVSIVYRLSQNNFLLYIAVTYTIGVGTATVNTRIYDWWYSSICALGMPSKANSDIYNSILTIIGILMALFVVYMIPQFNALVRKNLISRSKVITISIIYVLEIIGIMAVGIFPFGYNHFIAQTHVFFGAFVFYNMGVLMLLSAWLFSSFPKKFLNTNYILLAAGSAVYLVSYLLCFIIKVKWLRFPLAEFITAAIIIAWFMLVLSNIKRLSGTKE